MKNVLVDLHDPIVAWLYRWRPSVPPPHAVKARAILECAKRRKIRLLVETGTCFGEMARKCRKQFEEIWTIELSPSLAAEARRRLGKYRNVHVLCGDSGELLPQVLAQVHEPAVFWLDAHYSGGPTAKGLTECALVAELEAIAAHGRPDHVILIDDARLMGTGDFPSLDTVWELVRRINPGYHIALQDDIVRCEPPPGGTDDQR